MSLPPLHEHGRRVLRQPPVRPAVALRERVVQPSPEQLQAVEDAREEGRREGHAAGLREGRLELDRVAGSVARAIDVAVAAHRDQRAAEAAATVELALRIAQEVAGATVDEHGHALAGRVRDALARVDDGPLTVEVAPSRVTILTKALSDQEYLHVVAAADLADDEARVHGPWSSVDLSADARWAAVQDAVRGHLGLGGGPGRPDDAGAPVRMGRPPARPTPVEPDPGGSSAEGAKDGGDDDGRGAGGTS